jgi:hypothetical protein
VALLLVGATRATLNKPQPSILCCVAALEAAGGSQAPRLPMPEAGGYQPFRQNYPGVRMISDGRLRLKLPCFHSHSWQQNCRMVPVFSKLQQQLENSTLAGID